MKKSDKRINMRTAVVLAFYLILCSVGASSLFISCENHWIIELTQHMFCDDCGKPNVRCICDTADPVITYTVTFDSDGGSIVPEQIIAEGGKADKPAPDPVKAGYDFVYWFNAADDAEWNFDTVVTADITLKAKWEITTPVVDDPVVDDPVTYTVTFDSDGGSPVDKQTISEGGKADKPAPDPVKAGFNFVHWFNAANNAEWNFDTVVTADITLKAKWIAKTPLQLMNEADFGADAEITETFDINAANLEDALNSITAPGNYVVNMNGAATFSDIVTLSGDVTVSLRGDGGVILGSNINNTTHPAGDRFITVENGATLVLRDITLGGATLHQNHLYVILVAGGTLIMEEGSHITGLTGRVYAVSVSTNGTFIMKNGSSIYNNHLNNVNIASSYSIISINWPNASFVKDSGARIYNNSITNSGDGGGHVLGVLSSVNSGTPPDNPNPNRYITILRYRDTDISESETLSVTIDAAGTGIAEISGDWETP